MPDRQPTAPEALHFDGRLALNINEAAAAALGVSERLVRSQLFEIPHVHIGGRVVFPVDALRDWLTIRAREESGSVHRIADEILESLRGRQPRDQGR